MQIETFPNKQSPNDTKFLVTFDSLWEFITMATALKFAAETHGDRLANEMAAQIEKVTGTKI